MPRAVDCLRMLVSCRSPVRLPRRHVGHVATRRSSNCICAMSFNVHLLMQDPVKKTVPCATRVRPVGRVTRRGARARQQRASHLLMRVSCSFELQGNAGGGTGASFCAGEVVATTPPRPNAC